MNLGIIARNTIRTIPVLTLGLSLGCMQGKSGWQNFIEKTNIMIVDAGKKHDCVGRGEGEIEMESMKGEYIAKDIAKNNAYMDYKLRCVDSLALNIKIDRENGVITGVMANGSFLNIKLSVCGEENYSSGEMYYSTVAVCGQKD